jgi:hypothetical protein
VFESFARHVFGDLGAPLEIESFQTKVAGADELTPVAPRVTSAFCREEAAGGCCIAMPTRPVAMLSP